MKRSLKFIPFAVMVAMIIAWAAQNPATGIPTPTSTVTATATATLPTVTPSATVFWTPTAEVGSTSVSGGIVEEPTALGGQPHSGWFTPNAVMNMRICPATDCAIFKQTSQSVYFFDVIKTPEGEWWLCLDPAIPCQSFIAWYIPQFPAYGTVKWDK